MTSQVYWTNGNALVHNGGVNIKHTASGAFLKLSSTVTPPTKITLYLPLQGIPDGVTATQIMVDVGAAENAVMIEVDGFMSGKHISTNTTNVTTRAKPYFTCTLMTNEGGYVVGITVNLTDKTLSLRCMGRQSLLKSRSSVPCVDYLRQLQASFYFFMYM
jgi:hypothetical protein